MGEAQQIDLNIIDNEPSPGEMPPNQCQIAMHKKMEVRSWIRILVYTVLLLVGQSVATLLGRIYFTKGGKSNWLEALVQLIGFPVLVPLYLITPLQKNSPHQTTASNYANFKFPNSSLKTRSSIYIGLGLLMAANTMFYTLGLQYLPVSTYTLICASQLAFNAVFSVFLNGQNFTPYMVNSLVLLTMSSILLVFQKTDASTNSVSKRKYAVGFIFTLVASAGYSLLLSISQLVFQRVLKGPRFKLLLDLLIYESIVASCAIAVGLFASGEWRTIKGEMELYELGKVSYVMNLTWTALLWQAYSVGAVGLLFEVSALFSNVISTMGLPITPVLAVIFLKDKMDGIKGVSMALALWGFVSYSYQHYIDEFKGEKVDGVNNLYPTTSKNNNN